MVRHYFGKKNPNICGLHVIGLTYILNHAYIFLFIFYPREDMNRSRFLLELSFDLSDFLKIKNLKWREKIKLSNLQLKVLFDGNLETSLFDEFQNYFPEDDSKIGNSTV